MKRISRIITVALMSATLVFSVFTLPTTIKANENGAHHIANVAESELFTTNKSDDIAWRYEIINGKLHKRLFNWSTDEWIGDWILC